MEQLKSMKASLMNCAQSQMGNLSKVNAKELGEVIDMIKDLEEAIYYCTIIKAMEENEKQQPMYYTERMYPDHAYRDMDKDWGKMYYSESGGGSGRGGNGNGMSGGGSRNYSEPRDIREGRSPQYRRMYMESKEIHQDKTKTMKDLENYMHELTDDIMEMIKEATPEEKIMLQQKITALGSKIK